MYGRTLLLAAVAAAFALASTSADADLFHHAKKPDPEDASTALDPTIAAIQKALDEQRLKDAGDLLDRTLLSGAKDPRLFLLSGELDLLRGRYVEALDVLKQADSSSVTHAKALECEGIALSMLERSDEALAALQDAVAADPSAWRAWDALAGEYDHRRDWTRAEAAYDHAMTGSDGAAIVLNNRGYSRLLQGRFDAAKDDFVAALEKKPDLATARTNLRLAMAMKGEYERATAAGSQDDQAALLNNAGFAAMMRGDYAEAEALLTRAMQAKGEYYARAAQNLEVAKALEARQKAPPVASQ
jgi:Flp pilus assembly protein TadD